jgi:hypothetical protein
MFPVSFHYLSVLSKIALEEHHEEEKRRVDTKKERLKRPIEGKTQAPYSPHLEGNTKLEDNPHEDTKLFSSCTNEITLPESTPFPQYTHQACIHYI